MAEITISPVGRIDRRNLVTKGQSIDVLSRENLSVIGLKEEERRVKKVPGTDRLNSTTVGSYPFVSGARYYTKREVRKTFAFNQDGYIYHIDDNGNTTQKVGVFDKNAYPCWVNMRVSDTDILYFSEGVNTGMYSHDGNIGNDFIKETSVTLNFVGMVAWLDRLWGFEEESEDLYFSVNLEPTNFTDSTDAGVITIAARGGSKIQALIVINDVLYIFKEDLIARINGRTPSEFSVEIVVDNFGLPARRGIAQDRYSSNVYFLGSDYEAYSFSGTKESLKNLSYYIALSGDFSKDLVPVLNRENMEKVSSTFHDRKFYLHFVENGDTNPNLGWVFNTTNETDYVLRGAKITFFMQWDRHPDKGELLVGQYDTGRLMFMNRGLNWDNQASGATMSIKTQTKFIGGDSIRNIRARRVWLKSEVLGRDQVAVRTYLDTRLAKSDSTEDTYATFGESKALTSFINIPSQSAITSRQIPRHANSKGQNISFAVDETMAGRDWGFEAFVAEIILKNKKRSQKVGL